MPINDEHPKAGDRVGDRTVIRVMSDRIIFGQDEGTAKNCGAYMTSFREWFDYERRAVSALSQDKGTHDG